MPTQSPIRTLASIGLVVAWSGGFIGAQLGTDAGADPFTILSWRFALLSVIFLIACRVTGTSLSGWPLWKRPLLVGLFSQVGYLGCVFLAVSLGVHGGTASLIAALQPLLVMSVAGRLLGERTTSLGVAGAFIGLVGVALVVSGDIRAGHASAPLYLIPLAATICLTVGTLYSRRSVGSESLLQTITIQAILCSIAFSIIAALTGEFEFPKNGGSWIAIIWLILVPSIGGYGLYVFVTREFGATVVSTLLYLTPPTTMLWAWLLFRDPITTAGVVGLAISGVGVYLVLRARNQVRGLETIK